MTKTETGGAAKAASTARQLSNDARVLLTGWFGFGPKTSVKIGGEGAQSVLSDRAEVAMQELIAGGYVIAKPFNRFGRMEYVGTELCEGLRLSQSKMEELGKWSATKPNPAMLRARGGSDAE